MLKTIFGIGTGFIGAAFLLIFTLSSSGNDQSSSKAAPIQPNRKDYAIAIHGGAGVIPKDIDEQTRKEHYAALDSALTIGEKVLKHGGSALQAVQQTIIYLENNPMFNAGKGAVYTAEGKHELDAAIMDGSTMEAGAITGIKTVKNPILLARHVMDNSRHILFSSEGAEAYADQTDLERVKNSYYDTEYRYQQWKQANNEGDQSYLDAHSSRMRIHKYGTVGCVALDKNGKLAAGTSTGGLTNKEFGRVGDVPIVGAGTYANNRVAVSATGIGEEIMRYNVGFRVAAVMRYAGKSLDEATNHVINEVLDKDVAGIITVDRNGNIATPFNTLGMFRGMADSEGRHEVKIWE